MSFISNVMPIFSKSSTVDKAVKSILMCCNSSILDDWLNFLERMRRRDIFEAQLWDKDDAYELRLWASYRGQTLARTVRGMMYYERCVTVKLF